MEVNEDYFMDQLQLMRKCSGNDRVEHDFAKNTENHLVVIRGDEAKARGASQQNDKVGVHHANKHQEETFERLMNDTLGSRAKREHRENASRPASLPRNYKAMARHQMIFEAQAEQMQELTKKRSRHKEKKTAEQHARTERLVNERIMKKMVCAQQSMEERLRWRELHHENVTLKGQRYEAEKLQMFQQRQEDQARKMAISDNRGGLRKELHKIRHINRQMNDALRARKAAYQKRMKDAETEDWKARINEAAFKERPQPMRSNLESTWTAAPKSLEKSMSVPSLAMSRSVPTHMASPLASSVRKGHDSRLFKSWYRHG
jgi:hypothetical protein